MFLNTREAGILEGRGFFFREKVSGQVWLYILVKKTFIYGLIFSVFVFSVDFIFNNIFEERHRNRFNIVMGIKQDNQ